MAAAAAAPIRSYKANVVITQKAERKCVTLSIILTNSNYTGEDLSCKTH